MNWSFPIGHLLGSELRVHATFFLLLLWIGISAWTAGGPGQAAVSVLFVLALFACVVAHEFGHALVARRFGIGTPDITLLPIGGMARLERMPERPGQEIAVAVAGPLVNLAIWLALTLASGLETRMSILGNIEDPAQGFIERLAAMNLFLVLFNMIPAFPMDGGRVLRALLALRFGRVRATSAAARAGQVIAFLFGLWGLLGGNVILVLIAAFVFFAGAAESSDVALRSKSHNVPARDAMITNFDRLVPEDTLETAAQALVRTTQHEFPVVGKDGRLVGVLTRRAVAEGLGRGERAARVADAMTRDIPQVLYDSPLDEALERLSDLSVPAVAVTDPGGRLLGYITRENIGEWLLVAREPGER